MGTFVVGIDVEMQVACSGVQGGPPLGLALALDVLGHQGVGEHLVLPGHMRRHGPPIPKRNVGSIVLPFLDEEVHPGGRSGTMVQRITNL